MSQIAYQRYETGNYVVSLVGSSQRIIVLPRCFHLVTGVHQRSIAGCLSVNTAQLITLGFIVSPFEMERLHDAKAV